MSGPRIGNTRAPRARPVPIKTLVVRPGGSDSARGDLANPLATLQGALDRVPTVIDDARYRIDITGISDAGGQRFFMPPKISALPTDILIDGSGAFLQDINLAPVTIFATPTLYTTLNVTGSVSDPVHGLVTLSTSDNHPLNALRGKFIRGAVLGEFGVVISNTAGPNSSVYCTAPGALTAPVQVLDPSATIDWGDPAETFNYSALIAPLCDLALTGVKLRNTNNAFSIAGLFRTSRLFLHLCDVEGLSIERADPATISASYIHDGFFAVEDTKIIVQQSYLRALGMRLHEEGGQSWAQSAIEGCDALGHWIDFTRGGGFAIDFCDIISPRLDGAGVTPTNGVYYRGGSHARVRSSKINGASAAIYCEGPGYLLVDAVQGTTNSDVGIDLHDGAQVKAQSGTSVTGAAGNVRVGAAGIKTYAQLPFTDTTQLVRAS